MKTIYLSAKMKYLSKRCAYKKVESKKITMSKLYNFLLFIMKNRFRFLLGLSFFYFQCVFNLNAQTPIYAGASTNVGLSSTSGTVNKPGGTVAGDLLIAVFSLEKGSAVNLTFSGWTKLTEQNNGTDVGLESYYKIAGTSEPSSYSFTFSTSGNWCASLSRITGAHP